MTPEIARHAEKFIYFFETALAGSLQAAARKIGVSAPSLSQAVKKLESVCGAPLFLRSRDGLRLTRAGEELFSFCERYFRDLDEIQRSIVRTGDRKVQRLRVGTFSSIALYFWPRIVRALQEDPGLKLSIRTDRSKALLDALLKRELDVTLTVGAVKDAKVVSHSLYSDEFAFFGSTGFGKRALKRTELAAHDVLYIPDTADFNQRTIGDHIRGFGLVFRDEFEIDSLEVIAEFVSRGYGIGVLPLQVARYQRRTVKRLRIEGMPSPSFGLHHFYLSYRSDLEIRHGIVKTLLEVSKKSAREMALSTASTAAPRP